MQKAHRLVSHVLNLIEYVFRHQIIFKIISPFNVISRDESFPLNYVLWCKKYVAVDLHFM